MNAATKRMERLMRKATRIEYAVLFYEPHTGDEQYATRPTIKGGEVAYETALRSPKRKGRMVRLELRELYQNDRGEWEVGITDTIEGDGGEV